TETANITQKILRVLCVLRDKSKTFSSVLVFPSDCAATRASSRRSRLSPLENLGVWEAHHKSIMLSCIAPVSICAMIERLFASASAIRLPSPWILQKKDRQQIGFLKGSPRTEGGP